VSKARPELHHPRFHLVTDPRLPRQQLLVAIHAAAANGVDWIQVRDHQASARELLELTRDVVAIGRDHGVRVALNDRIDVALAAGAAGVQLGARSLPIAVARRIAPGLAIGASVHDLAGALQAEAAGATWVTFGHVFPTSSHPSEPPRGLDELAAVARAARCPVLAIGGVGPDEVGAVLDTGAAGIAVISAILNAEDPGQATRELRQRLDRRARGDGPTRR
jgi:thiamine-phosphate pyrophosphorylase